MIGETQPQQNANASSQAYPGEDAAARLKIAKEALAHDLDFERENRNHATEDFKMYANEQWAAMDLAQRRRHRRPTPTHNRFPQFVAQIVGEVWRNPPGIQCHPADNEATREVASIREGIIRSIERQSGAENIYTLSLEQAVVGGIGGHMRIRLVKTGPFDVEPRIEQIVDPFAVVWDSRAVAPDRSDAKHCHVLADISQDDFKRMFPNASLTSVARDRPMSLQRDMNRQYGAPRIKVAEYWCVHEEPATVMELRHWTGVTQEITDADEPITDEALAAFAAQGWEVFRQGEWTKKRITVQLRSDSEWLTDEVEWPGERIPIFTITGHEMPVGETMVRWGLIRHAKDSQRQLNWLKAMEMEHLALSPRVPWTVAAESIEGYQNEWSTANQSPQPYLPYNAFDEQGRPLPQPRRADPIQSNPGFLNAALAAVDDMKAEMGIYDASLGARSNETSGVAIQAREAQGDTVTFVFLAKMKIAIEALGRELNVLIPKLYGSQKLIRILGPDSQPAIVDMEAQGLNLDNGRYDVIVKTGPAFESQRQEARQNIVSLLQSPVPPPIYIELLCQLIELGDWDQADKLGERIRAVATAAGLLPPMQGGPGAPTPALPPPPGAPGLPPGLPAPGPAAPPGAPPLPDIAPPFAQGAPSVPPLAVPAGQQRVGPQVSPFAAEPAGLAGMRS